MTKSVCAHAAEPIPEQAEAAIRALLRSGDLFRYTATAGSLVSQLEATFAEFMGVPFALAVNSCSSALFLALKALDLPPDSGVLLPAFTFAAVPSAVLHAGCEPVLVDVANDYRLCLRDFETKARQRNVRAVIISHMRGHTSDMDAVIQICEARGIPLIEDAAHSLGATWAGRKIGTMGQIGCFSFQSYKMINAGEGGMMIARDPDLIARAIIMSGAYEHNWSKHPAVTDSFGVWQNRLPLYNMRMSNLSAAVALPQIEEVPRRVRDGLFNHDYLASLLNASDCFEVPAPMPKESRAPDSIQFNLRGFETDHDALRFKSLAGEMGVEVQIFGLSENNARAFWNWGFVGAQSNLDATRAMLMRACDVRLPVHLGRAELDRIAAVLTDAADVVKRSP